MTFHQLKILESVAKNLNITHASARLHLSQPTVSQQLKYHGVEVSWGQDELARVSRIVKEPLNNYCIRDGFGFARLISLGVIVLRCYIAMVLAAVVNFGL